MTNAAATMHRHLLLVCLILLAACVPGSGPAASSPTASPNPAAAPTTAALPTADAATPAARINLAPDPVATLDTILHQVERLRGIEARQSIVPVLALPAEYGSAAQAALANDWPSIDLENQVRLLQFLGLAPSAVNVEALTVAAGVGAILSAPDGSLTIAAGPLPEDDLVRVACAYDRTLLMQAFPESTPTRQAQACRDDFDACLASRALLEGDAALLAEQWRRTFGGKALPTPEMPIGCGALPLRAALDAAGLSGILSFPTEQGLAFTRAVYLKGGWAAVDQAHTIPPLSTEQILHPDRYPKDAPRPPKLEDLAASLGAGWATLDAGGLGEWRTLLTLQAFLQPDQAALAAAGWNGDAYALLTQPTQALTAWVLLTRWDTVRDAHEFSGAFRTYGEGRFGPSKRVGSSLAWTIPEGIIVLDVGNDQTLWIQAPDAQTAATLRAATRFPLH